MHISWEFTFGIKVIAVELNPYNLELFRKKCIIALQKSSPMVSQHPMKNSTVNPSGPGDLFRFIFFNVDQIISLVIGASNKDL